MPRSRQRARAAWCGACGGGGGQEGVRSPSRAGGLFVMRSRTQRQAGPVSYGIRDKEWAVRAMKCCVHGTSKSGARRYEGYAVRERWGAAIAASGPEVTRGSRFVRRHQPAALPRLGASSGETNIRNMSCMLCRRCGCSHRAAEMQGSEGAPTAGMAVEAGEQDKQCHSNVICGEMKFAAANAKVMK